MTERFHGRCVLITGAAGGMGRALAEGFAREGAELILSDIEAAGLDASLTELQGRGVQCSSYRIDLSSEAELLKTADAICGKHPKLDVLINNAGLAYGEVAHGFEKLGQQKWLRYLSVNSVAPLLLAQALRAPLAQARGMVLNISSMASYSPGTAYGVTKAALNAMTYGMASAFAADGIRVNAIAPGLVETPASSMQLPPGTLERVQGMQMLNKLKGSAEDVAALALFLASDDARFVTSEIVSCDAGNRLRGWRG
jgi:NAD(P)-dependent dehydrogenase (short-subunit alcohol dehydrogenase family)